MNTPSHLKYTRQDEWIHLENGIATIGITAYAQDQLSDVVFAEIKVAQGDGIVAGKLIAVVESVKASSDIDAPLSGTVIAVNDELNTTPEIINTDPYGQAWMIKVQLNQPGEMDGLLSASEYEEYRKK
jgi:glycine cleavage system H protein